MSDPAGIMAQRGAERIRPAFSFEAINFRCAPCRAFPAAPDDV